MVNEGSEWKRNDDILQRNNNGNMYMEYTKFIYNKTHAEAIVKVKSLQSIVEGADIKIGNISSSKFYPKIVAKDVSYTGSTIGAIYINGDSINYRHLKGTMPENYVTCFYIRWELF